MPLSNAVRDAFNKGDGAGRRAALPDNARVRTTIQPHKKDIGYIEKVPHANDPSSPNNRIKSLLLRFVGVDEPSRQFFGRVPEEFETFNREGKKTPSYLSINLVKALGYSLEDVDDDTLKNLTARELIGKTVEVVLGVEDDPQFNAGDPVEVEKARENPLYAKRNVVKFINRASATAPARSGGAAAPGAQTAQPQALPSNDPWAAVGAAPADDPWAGAALTGATL